MILFIRSAVNGGGASAAIPAGSLLRRERILQPGVGKIFDNHPRHRLEQLELVALFRDPEHDHSLQGRSEEHTSELQSLAYLVCRLLLEKKKKIKYQHKNII